MKRTYLALGIMLATAAASAVDLNTQAEKTGYAIGADLGGNLFQFNTEKKQLVDFDALVVGLRDAHEKRDLSMSEDEMNQALMVFSKEAETAMKKKIEGMQAEVANESKQFLEDNAKKDGVVTTESGLQYVVVEEGEGKVPVTESQVQVTYEGRLIDGTVFDGSEEPVTFGLEEVIDGWIEGIQLMKEGAKYTFFIPSELAYGDVGQPSAGILPGSVLIFDVTLVKVLEDKEQPIEGVAVEEVTEVVASVEATVEETTEVAAEAAEKVGEKAVESVEVAAEEVKVTAEETGEVTTESAEKVGEEAIDSVETAAEDVEVSAEKTSEATAEVAKTESTMNEVAKMADNAHESGEEAAVAEIATDAAEKTTAAIEEIAEEQTEVAVNDVEKMAENAVKNSAEAVEEQVSDVIEEAAGN